MLQAAKSALSMLKALLGVGLSEVELQTWTMADVATAKKRLDEAARPASFGQLGGSRPDDTRDRFRSWWGGNFLATPLEDLPCCSVSGRSMLPILQIRVDELPYVPEVLNDVALLTLWFDVETEHVSEPKSGVGFVVRTYGSLEGLVSLGPGYREHPTLPTLPITWNLLECDLPDWEDFDATASEAAAEFEGDGWFSAHPGQEARSALQKLMPIKVGGYPQWWQSPQSVNDGRFAFFLDSTAKGSIGFPAGGSANFFRTRDSWEMRVDFT